MEKKLFSKKTKMKVLTMMTAIFLFLGVFGTGAYAFSDGVKSVIDSTIASFVSFVFGNDIKKEIKDYADEKAKELKDHTRNEIKAAKEELKSYVKDEVEQGKKSIDEDIEREKQAVTIKVNEAVELQKGELKNKIEKEFQENNKIDIDQAILDGIEEGINE